MKKGYNGFSRTRRIEAVAFFNAKQLPPPKICEVCGQTKGKILYHTEDYSKPFGQEIGKYKLCYTCHSMLLMRHGPSMPKKYQEYKNKIVNGYNFLPVSGWYYFKKLFVDELTIIAPFEKSKNTNVKILDRIEKEGELLTNLNKARIKEIKKSSLAQ